MSTFLKIQGKHGGGQVLRSALALSAITQTPFLIENIRGKRPSPGLKAQHLTCVRAMESLCQAKVEGAELGSTTLHFSPSKLPSGEHSFSIGTAGSASLLLHSLFYPFACHPKGGRLSLFGGTHGTLAPTFDYLEGVWQPLLQAMGGKVTLDCPAFGLVPKGSGQLDVTIPGKQHFQEVRWLKRPSLNRVMLRVLVANPLGKSSRYDGNIVGAQAFAAAKGLLQNMGYPLQLETQSVQAQSPGIILTLLCEYGMFRAGFTVWGSKKKSPEVLGAEVSSLALRFLTNQAFLDEHSADQMMLPLSIGTGESVFSTPSITPHMKSHAEVIQTFLPFRKVEFGDYKHGCCLVRISER